MVYRSIMCPFAAQLSQSERQTKNTTLFGVDIKSVVPDAEGAARWMLHFRTRLPDCIVASVREMHDDDGFPHSFGCEVSLRRWRLENIVRQRASSPGAFERSVLAAVVLYVF